MHSRALVAKVRRMLAERHYSHRQIAARLGISRGSVDAIARRDGPLRCDPATTESSFKNSAKPTPDATVTSSSSAAPTRRGPGPPERQLLPGPDTATEQGNVSQCEPASQYLAVAASGPADPLEADFDDEPLVYERCPTCGLRVTMPCLACRLEFEHQRRLRRARLERRLAAPDWPPDFARQISRVHTDELPDDDDAPRRRRRRKPARSRPAPGCSAPAPD